METDPNDQVLHDNFIPRYSALAEVTPNRLVLIGVYLLMGSSGILLIGSCVGGLTSSKMTWMGAIMALFSGVAGFVCLCVVVQTHRRYRQARRDLVSRPPDLE